MFGFFLDQKIVNAHECARVIYENNKIFNAPRVHHESTTSAPRVHHECTTSAPRVHHERTTSAPRWHHECTTSAPRVHHDGTTSAPRVHHESTTSSYAAPSHYKIVVLLKYNKLDIKVHSLFGLISQNTWYSLAQWGKMGGQAAMNIFRILIFSFKNRLN